VHLRPGGRARHEREEAASFCRRMGFEDISLRFVKDLD
jgi:hypothetical protein